VIFFSQNALYLDFFLFYLENVLVTFDEVNDFFFLEIENLFFVGIEIDSDSFLVILMNLMNGNVNGNVNENENLKKNGNENGREMEI